MSHQLTHHLPTINGDVCRVRTGYERVLAHATASNFAGSARYDGVVEDINQKLKMVRIRYENGETDVFSFADQYSGTSGLVIEQQIALAVKLGDTVKKGDIIIYNKHFFKGDPYTKQVDWKHGVVANVMIVENTNTLEDANGITERLGEKFGIGPIEPVMVVLNNTTIVHDILPVGAHVDQGDVLITYEDGDLGESLILSNKDEETLAMIQQLNRSSSKATISGTLVSIDAFYGCPIPEMHPTLAKVVEKIASYKNGRNRYSRDTDAEYDNPLSMPLPKDERFKGVKFDENTIVLQFYIRHMLGAGIGDKLVYDSSLKSIISNVFPKPIVTESGVEVDAVFSGTGILHRVINSPMMVGLLSRVLEQTEKNMIDMWTINKK